MVYEAFSLVLFSSTCHCRVIPIVFLDREANKEEINTVKGINILTIVCVRSDRSAI